MQVVSSDSLTIQSTTATGILRLVGQIFQQVAKVEPQLRCYRLKLLLAGISRRPGI